MGLLWRFLDTLHEKHKVWSLGISHKDVVWKGHFHSFMIFFSFSWYVSWVTFFWISGFFSASQIPLVLVQIYNVHALTFLVNRFRCLYLFTNTDSSQYSVSQCILLPHVRLLQDIYFIMDILQMRNFLNEVQTRYLFFFNFTKDTWVKFLVHFM